jgi:hypothetical protein
LAEDDARLGVEELADISRLIREHVIASVDSNNMARQRSLGEDNNDLDG